MNSKSTSMFIATLLVVLSSATALAQGLPKVMISEFRPSGPGGNRDEFIELYNDSGSPITVDGTGWTIQSSNGVIITIPAGTTIRARGNLLITDSGFTIGGYPLDDNSSVSGDITYDANIGDSAGIALFASTTDLSAATRLDAFGYAASPALFKEGAGYPSPKVGSFEQSFIRNLNTGTPRDTDDNASDFIYINTTASDGGILGAPGPQARNSPRQRNTVVVPSIFDPAVALTATPNRVRNTNPLPGGNGTFGSIIIRRAFTNYSDRAVRYLRFRVVDITTAGTPNVCNGGPCADVRLLSTNSVTNVQTSQGPRNVSGTTLEEPPNQPNGGGLNSSARVADISLATPLQPGQSINLQWRLGVMTKGTFLFYVNTEARFTPDEPPVN